MRCLFFVLFCSSRDFKTVFYVCSKFVFSCEMNPQVPLDRYVMHAAYLPFCVVRKMDFAGKTLTPAFFLPVPAKGGDYYRLLPNGFFAVTASHASLSETKCVHVQNDPKGKGAQILNFHLTSAKEVDANCPAKLPRGKSSDLDLKKMVRQLLVSVTSFEYMLLPKVSFFQSFRASGK